MYFFCTCSLLDVLADRKDRRWLSGHVLINGEKQPHNFKCASGYVVQVCGVCLHTRLRVCMRVSVFLSVSAHTCLCVQVHAAEITIANLRMHMYPLEYCIYLMLANVVYF